MDNMEGRGEIVKTDVETDTPGITLDASIVRYNITFSDRLIRGVRTVGKETTR